MTTPRSHYDVASAEIDAGCLLQLLEVIVQSDCDLCRDGMNGLQVETLTLIGSMAWVARDIARRLTESSLGSLKNN